LYDSLPSFGNWIGRDLDPPPVPDHEVLDGDTLRVGGFSFDVRHTPGHSPGSVSYLGQRVIFGGDVLFNGSVGRTDLPGGDAGTLMHSIQSTFLSLPDSTVVYSGHGPETTIGVERMTNPFLTGAYRVE
jgi:glyoxylase-like metal-dependent hydrolase (beta-lactamase superfamily II)